MLWEIAGWPLRRQVPSGAGQYYRTMPVSKKCQHKCNYLLLRYARCVTTIVGALGNCRLAPEEAGFFGRRTILQDNAGYEKVPKSNYPRFQSRRIQSTIFSRILCSGRSPKTLEYSTLEEFSNTVLWNSRILCFGMLEYSALECSNTLPWNARILCFGVLETLLWSAQMPFLESLMKNVHPST